MEGHRGRSSSAGHQPNQRISHSPSPQNFHNQSSPTDLSTSPNFTQPFNPHISPTESNIEYNLSSSYLNGSAQQPPFPQHVLPSNDYVGRGFEQSFQQNGLESSFQQETTHVTDHQANHQFQQDALGLAPNYEAYTQQQQEFIAKQGQDFGFLDPQLEASDQSQGHINPADLMSDMSSPQNMAPTPPSLMPPNGHSSGPTSPVANAGQQWSPSHSRNASASLDPSAAYNNGPQQEWQGMQFHTHRRTRSDAPSDVSSSAAPSPFLPHQESFDGFEPNPSPLLNPQQDPQIFESGLGIEQFSISDARHPGHSPRHSPFVSPRMSAQPGLGLAQDTSFMPLQNPNSNFNGAPGSQIYTSEGFPSESFPPESFPPFQPEERLGSNDMGQATQMAPPEINVQLAPTTQQSSFDVPGRPENGFDALSPPDNRGRKNGRIRAKSDTYISRPVTPSSTTSTLGSNDSSIDRRRSLSPAYGPAFSPNISRESSPAPRSPSRRSSTNSIPNRDYILELADPNRPPASGNEKRVQKHPATFQCTLCPKKFTRAYNLRSHLRTHTDERPFVCTVCGKAFARQHDRKRHEGLHSGEKKFVCRGELGTGGSWGCGRRFARADALGRHFRSEAGRVCIKPLLDEEAMERQRLYDEQMMNQSMQAGGMQPQPPMNGNMQNGGFTLPAALLLQYPALQGLQWDQLGQGGDEEISGRSSFDASSGGDYYDEPDDNGYVSGPGTAYSTGNTWEADINNRDWASDYEGR